MTPSALDLARRRAKYLTDLLWHIGVFVVLNAFFWTLDLLLGISGLQWAFWITLFWGLALAFHVVAYLIDGLGVEERRTRRYLADQDDHGGSSDD